jgi:hypothetical protein
LALLEDEIRERIAGLAALSRSQCTAQIGAWAGRVRMHQSGPDGERTRIGARILLEKLRKLAWSMDAGKVESLELSWSTRDWEAYIRENERLAAKAEVQSAETEASDVASVWDTP